MFAELHVAILSRLCRFVNTVLVQYLACWVFQLNRKHALHWGSLTQRRPGCSLVLSSNWSWHLPFGRNLEWQLSDDQHQHQRRPTTRLLTSLTLATCACCWEDRDMLGLSQGFDEIHAVITVTCTHVKRETNMQADITWYSPPKDCITWRDFSLNLVSSNTVTLCSNNLSNKSDHFSAWAPHHHAHPVLSF